jgi:hypothetical protein
MAATDCFVGFSRPTQRGKRACLDCLGRVGQDYSFYQDCQQDATYHSPKAPSITSCPMASQLPGHCWYGCGPLAELEGPINMLKPSCT